MTLREVITREFEPVKMPLEEAVQWALDNVKIRPGFRELVELARERGWRVVVVSSGFHELIEPMLEHEGVDVELHANRVDAQPDGWRVIWRYDDGDCEVCGESCKRSTVRRLAGDDEVVYIGDGISDRCAAEASDRVFARGPRRLPRRARRALRALRRLQLDRGEPRVTFEVEIKGVPNEEALRDLFHARARRAPKIVLETTHEAGDAWIRAGFTETARVLEAPVDELERHIGARKGAVVRLDSSAERRRRGRRPRGPPIRAAPAGRLAGSIVLPPPRRAGRPSTTSSATASPRCSGGSRRRSRTAWGLVRHRHGRGGGRGRSLRRARARPGGRRVPVRARALRLASPGEVIALGANPRLMGRLTGADLDRFGRGAHRQERRRAPAARRVAGRARACVPHPARGLRIRPRSQRRRGDRDHAVVTQVLLLHAFPFDAHVWASSGRHSREPATRSSLRTCRDGRGHRVRRVGEARARRG